MAAAWTERYLNACVLPEGGPTHLHLGTRPGHQASADARLDLLSVLPRSQVDALSPVDLLTCEDHGGVLQRSTWERTALVDPDGVQCDRPRPARQAVRATAPLCRRTWRALGW